MPGFDGKGPLGRGSMTGRALGYCANYVPKALSVFRRFPGYFRGTGLFTHGSGRNSPGFGLGRRLRFRRWFW